MADAPKAGAVNTHAVKWDGFGQRSALNYWLTLRLQYALHGYANWHRRESTPTPIFASENSMEAPHHQTVPDLLNQVSAIAFVVGDA